MTTPDSQTSQNALNFFKNSQILGHFCKSLVARFKLTWSSSRFLTKSIFLVLQLWKNCDKLLMEYTLYLKPQFPELKKPKQNRVKSRIKFCRNMFIESIERLLFITAVLEVFFFFMLSTTLLSYKQNRGPRHLQRT